MKAVQCYEGDGDLPLIYQKPIEMTVRPTEYREIDPFDSPFMNALPNEKAEHWAFELVYDLEMPSRPDMKKLKWKLGQGIGFKVKYTILMDHARIIAQGILRDVILSSVPQLRSDEGPFQWDTISLRGELIPDE